MFWIGTEHLSVNHTYVYDFVYACSGVVWGSWPSQVQLVYLLLAPTWALTLNAMSSWHQQSLVGLCATLCPSPPIITQLNAAMLKQPQACTSWARLCFCVSSTWHIRAAMTSFVLTNPPLSSICAVAELFSSASRCLLKKIIRELDSSHAVSDVSWTRSKWTRFAINRCRTSVQLWSCTDFPSDRIKFFQVWQDYRLADECILLVQLIGVSKQLLTVILIVTLCMSCVIFLSIFGDKSCLGHPRLEH